MSVETVTLVSYNHASERMRLLWLLSRVLASVMSLMCGERSFLSTHDFASLSTTNSRSRQNVGMRIHFKCILILLIISFWTTAFAWPYIVNNWNCTLVHCFCVINRFLSGFFVLASFCDNLRCAGGSSVSLRVWTVRFPKINIWSKGSMKAILIS